MTLVTKTNVNALMAQASVRTNSRNISSSMERLASGSRINSAKDDAAGLAISNDMTSKIHGLSMAIRNANDGISLVQTAEGALGSITDMLQRLRELAVQASTATYSESQRGAIDVEAKKLVEEIDHISSNTQFNGITLLDGSFQNQQLSVGPDGKADQQLSMSIDSAQIDALGVGTSSIPTTLQTTSSTGGTPILNPANGHYYEIISERTSWNDAFSAANSATFNGKTGYLATVTSLNENTFIGSLIGPDGNGYDVSGLNLPLSVGGGYYWIGGSDSANEGAWKWVDGPESGQSFSSNGQPIGGKFSNWFPGSTLHGTQPMSAAEGTPGQSALNDDGLALDRAWNYQWYDLPVQDTNFTYGEYVKGYVIEYSGITPPSDTSQSSSAISSLMLTSPEGAATAVTSLDSALSRVNNTRSSLGAIQNRLISVVQNLDNYSMNLTASRSQITDTDFAAETSKLASSQIIQQAGMADLPP